MLCPSARGCEDPLQLNCAKVDGPSSKVRNITINKDGKEDGGEVSKYLNQVVYMSRRDDQGLKGCGKTVKVNLFNEVMSLHAAKTDGKNPRSSHHVLG
jgi:hypothetical protein